MMQLYNLSNDIQVQITFYLNDQEKIIYGSCCSYFYQNLIISSHSSRRFKILNGSTFLKDYLNNDQEICERFRKCIHFPEHQLYIRLDTIDYASSFFPFRKISYLKSNFNQLYYTNLLSQIEKIHTLDIQVTSFENSSEKLALDTLDIRNLVISTFLSPLTSLPVTLPASLETFSLSGPCPSLPGGIWNSLSHLHKLVLNRIDAISDVNMFVNVRIIHFYSCPNIIDITSLQRTRIILIENCLGIIDYRNTLTYSHQITIKASNPHAVIDVSCFKEVKSLVLSVPLSVCITNSPINTLSRTLKRLNITQEILYHLLPSFDHIQELTISYSDEITNVNIFSSIPILYLNSLDNVTSLDGLGYDENISKRLRNRSVSIAQLRNVHDFTPLNTIPIIKIDYCENFHDLTQVKNVKNLSVRYCKNVVMPSSILQNQIVRLAGEMNEDLLYCFPNVEELDLLHAKGLQSLEGLETLNKLKRILISTDWKEQKTKGWELLKQHYMKFIPHKSSSTFTYVKKL